MNGFWDVGSVVLMVLATHPPCEAHFAGGGGLRALLGILALISRNPDLHLDSWRPPVVMLTTLLSMTLRHVRFARDIEAALFEALADVPHDNVAATQLLIDLASGQLIATLAFNGTRQWLTADSTLGGAFPVSPASSSATFVDYESAVRKGQLRLGEFFLPDSAPQAWAPFEPAMDVLCDRLFGTDQHPVQLPEEFRSHARQVVVHLATGLRSVQSPSYLQAVLRRELPASAIAQVAALPPASLRKALSDDMRPGVSLSILSSLLRQETVPHAIKFVEAGWAEVTSQPTLPFPQAGRGLGVAGWVQWSAHASGSPRWRGASKELPLWTLRFGPGLCATLELSIDVVADECALKLMTRPGAKPQFALFPAIEPDVWVHLGLSIDGAGMGSKVSLYVNGQLLGAIASSEFVSSLAEVEPAATVVFRVGFPEGASGAFTGRSVAFGPAAVFSSSVGHGTIARMFLANQNEPLPAGYRPHLVDLREVEHLTDRELRLVAFCTKPATDAASPNRPGRGGAPSATTPPFSIETIQDSDPVEDGDIAVVLHPADPVLGGKAQVQDYGNACLGVPNLAKQDECFWLVNPHFAPRRCTSIGHQIAAANGHAVLLAWLSAAIADGEPEIAAAVIRCLGSLSNRLKFERLTGGTAWHTAVRTLFGGGRTTAKDVVLRELLDVAVRTPSGFSTVPLTLDPATTILASIYVAEHALLRWEFLSYLPSSVALKILDALKTLVVPANPLRAFNAHRLFLAGLATHFTYGLSRSYVHPGALLAAEEVLLFALDAVPQPAAAAGEILGFLALSVPAGGNAAECSQRLCTALPVEPCVSTVRSVLLRACIRAMNRRGDELIAAFASVCPMWWIAVMTDVHAGPVSVGLALRLFALLITDANFARRSRRNSITGMLMQACVPYAHQIDVLNGLALLGAGVACFSQPAMIQSSAAVTPSCDVAFLPALLRCVRALAKTVADDSGASSEDLKLHAATIAGHFEKLKAVATYRPSRLRATAMAVYAVCCFRSVKRDRSPAKAGIAALRLPTVLLEDEECDRRLGLVQHTLDFVASLLPNNTVLECFTAVAHPSAMSEVAWLLFCLVPAPPEVPTDSAMVRQATQDDCALVIADSSDDEPNESASPDNRNVHDAPTSAVLTNNSSIWSVRDYTYPVTARHKATMVDEATTFISALVIAVASSNTGLVPLTGSSVKGPPLVALLHQLLNACPQGVSLFSRHWYQSKLMTIFFDALAKAIVRIDAVPRGNALGDVSANLLRSAAALALYAVERLAAGLAASAGDCIAFVNTIRFETKKHSVPEMASLSNRMITASVDWTLYALGPGHHGWSRRVMVKSMEAVVNYASVIFAAPLSTDALRSLIPRLAECSLGVLIDYDASRTAEGRLVGDLWYKLFHVSKDSPVLKEGFIDAAASPRVDLLHGGFDLLYREHDPIDSFTGWFADSRYAVSAFFRKCYGRHPIKYVECAPQRHARAAAKAESLWQIGSMQAEMRATETITNCKASFDKVADGGTLVEQSLISLRAAGVMQQWLADPPVVEPLVPAAERDLPQAVDYDQRLPGHVTWEPSSGHLFINATADCGVAVGTLVAATVPVFGSSLSLGVILEPGASAVPTPGMRPLIPTAPGKALLTPAAQLLLTRILGAQTAPIQYITNVYVLSGGDSHIATVVLTQTEMCFVTMSQYSPSTQEFIVAQPQAHDAASKRQTTRAVVMNMLRRFLPNAASGTNRVLSTETEGCFRFSQYYRQIKADASKRRSNTDTAPRVWRFSTAWIQTAANRSFQHQRAAVELTLESRESWFFVVLDEELTMRKVERDRMVAALLGVAPWVQHEMTASLRSRVAGGQRLWLKRQLSTLGYLALVNAAGSRTPCDLTQYPVMPWVISCTNPPAAAEGDDALADGLRLQPNEMRDLAKPIGATNAQRAEEIAMRYREWLDDETPPFHHGTHYSSSAVVMYYLVRLNHFTAQSARYQGGRLDVADRLFHSVPEAWQSSTGARGGDTKELIPEMYHLPELVSNANGVKLGTRRDGVQLDRVVLPSWAASAHKFMVVHRAALESEAVGASLNSWIDLTFGCKQQGDEAVGACNVFHHVSYERGLQKAMESAASEETRMAIVAQVENFGLTPRNAFKAPHPKRAPLPPAAGPQSRQEMFLAAWHALIERPARNVVRHPRDVNAAGGAPRTIREFDGNFYLSSDRHLYPIARPSQSIEWRGRHDVTVRSKEGELLSSLSPIAPYGEGDIMAIACGASGHVLCVATARVTVFVFVRKCATAPFHLQSILRHNQSFGTRPKRVSMRLFLNGVLTVVVDGRYVGCWTVTVQRSRFCYLIDTRKPVPEDPTVRIDDLEYGDVVGVCLDGRDDGRSGLMYVAFEWGLALLSRRGNLLASTGVRQAAVSVSASRQRAQSTITAAAPVSPNSSMSDSTGLQHLSGTQRLRVMSALQEPLTCICHLPFTTYSPQEIVLAGHADGSLSVWICLSVISVKDPAAYRLAFHTMQPRADDLRPVPATSVVPRGDRNFAVAYEDGSVATFASPAPDSDPL
jgi:hypothetical protein